MMKQKKLKLNLNFINTNRSYLFLVLILLCGIFVNKFFSAYNINAVTGNGSLFIWLGLGFTVCMIAGHFDLSAMYVSTLAALLCLGLRANNDLPWIVCILIATLSGTVTGLANGLLVSKVKIPSFIVTLGMQFVLKGVMYIYTGGAELSIGRDYSANEFLAATLGPIPLSVFFVITTVATFILMIVLRYTRLGRNICMVGGNLDTAWLAGVKSDLITTVAFMISGTVCGLGGALNGIYSGAASITMGEKGISPLMIALTATIIGGTSVYGGKGSVIWTYVSLIAIAFLKSLCKKTETQVLVIAAILIVCIAYETVAQYRRNRIVGMRPNLHLKHLQEMQK